MEILNSSEFVNEKLDIKPISKKTLDEMGNEPEHDEKTKKFILIYNLKYNIGTRRYDSKQRVTVRNDDLVDGKLPLKFGTIEGKFDCNYCTKLKTLEGAPISALSFECHDCTSLESLKHAPKFVDGLFNCCECPNLTSLEGMPNEVGNLIVSSSGITSLKGAPKIIYGYLDCAHCKNLKTIEGAPSRIGGDFDLFDCENLVSLKGAPEYVGGDLNMEGCVSLPSDESANLPKTVMGEIKPPLNMSLKR